MVEEENKEKQQKSEASEWVKSIVIAIILAVIIKLFFFDFVMVKGSSMYPTLEDKDRLIVNKIEYLVGEPDYGEIVILKATQTKDYVKRVIAKGGDTIEIKNQVVYLNGQALEEAYVNPKPYEDFALVTVPEGKYFVMGDNRANSSDSRYQSLGFVEEDAIIGHVFFRFWPFSKFGSVNNGQK